MPAFPAAHDLTRQLDQENIELLTGRVEALRADNERLKAEMAKSQNDTHEFVAYFQREVWECKISMSAEESGPLTTIGLVAAPFRWRAKTA